MDINDVKKKFAELVEKYPDSIYCWEIINDKTEDFKVVRITVKSQPGLVMLKQFNKILGATDILFKSCTDYFWYIDCLFMENIKIED